MKKNRKALLLAALMILSVMLFTACGTPTVEGGNATEAPLSATADYKVTVVDASGTPCADVQAVKFMQNGQQAAMQLVKDGTAVKNMNRGDYTVELQFGDTDITYAYDKAAAILSKEKTELQIVVSQVLTETVDITVSEQFEHKTEEGGLEIEVKTTTYKAYYVSAGGSEITLNPSSMSYFVFMPDVAGTYEVSLIGSDAAIGYYGAMHFVQLTSAAEVVNNKFTISASEGSMGSNYVIGVAAGEGKATLVIKRTGDPAWSVDQEPWTEYVLKHNPVEYTLPAGTQLQKFDLTASTDTYKLVLNQEDGFYHLNSADGPLVYVRVGEPETEGTGEKESGRSTAAQAVPGEYLPSLQKMLETQGIRRYFYDENGNFLKKEDYSGNIETYIKCKDKTTGVYPLTVDLQYFIQQYGEQAGWWNTEGETYLFLDSNNNRVPGINHEIAWLVLCVYAA